MHPDYPSSDAVAPAMGNHLVDPTSPEFHGSPFTRTWIYGTYDGRVTFYEEMLSRDYMLSKPNLCFDIKLPPAVGKSGFYPMKSCIRYSADTNSYTVSMEGFVRREAIPPSTLVRADAGLSNIHSMHGAMGHERRATAV